MIIVNFSHPITEAQQAQIEEMTGRSIQKIISAPVQFNNSAPFMKQVAILVNEIKLTAEAWQTEPILINPPAFAPIAVAIVAELHGRMGYFPTMIRIRPVGNSTPPRYEIAELLNLQSFRENARERR